MPSLPESGGGPGGGGGTLVTAWGTSGGRPSGGGGILPLPVNGEGPGGGGGDTNIPPTNDGFPGRPLPAATEGNADGSPCGASKKGVPW